MKLNAIVAVTMLALSGAVFAAGDAQAQATRTWVSGVGDDANPCSRTAPCKTFQGSINKTAAGGEIDCLDPGGFGAVTITKSMTIDCAGVAGGILNAGVTGVNVNDSGGGAPGTAVVTLRNLSFQGVGTGSIGINFTSGAVLHVENCEISGNGGGTATGLKFSPGTAAELFVRDTTLSHNGSGPNGGGIEISPTTGGSATAVLERVTSVDNAVGLRTEPVSGGTINASVTDSVLGHNTFHGLVANSTSSTVNVLVESTSLSENANSGIRASGASVTVRLANNQITGNAIAINPSNSALVQSYGNNEIDANTAPGTAPGLISQH